MEGARAEADTATRLRLSRRRRHRGNHSTVCGLRGMPGGRRGDPRAFPTPAGMWTKWVTTLLHCGRVRFPHKMSTKSTCDTAVGRDTTVRGCPPSLLLQTESGDPKSSRC